MQCTSTRKSPLRAVRRYVRCRGSRLGQQLLQEDGPADQSIATLADARLDGQVEIAGFVDQAADFAGRLVTSTSSTCRRRVTSSLGMRASSSCPMGPARCDRVRPR
jgi:hypothetical protein